MDILRSSASMITTSSNTIPTSVNARLAAAFESWRERDLDMIQVPHPLLGRIPMREMMFFTIYHGQQHHVVGAKGRLPRFNPTASA